jgi:hypothetical protein
VPSTILFQKLTVSDATPLVICVILTQPEVLQL